MCEIPERSRMISTGAWSPGTRRVSPARAAASRMGRPKSDVMRDLTAACGVQQGRRFTKEARPIVDLVSAIYGGRCVLSFVIPQQTRRPVLKGRSVAPIALLVALSVATELSAQNRTAPATTAKGGAHLTYNVAPIGNEARYRVF